MGKSSNRSLYFDKHIKNLESPEDYLLALAKSPYSTHRKLSLLLNAQFKILKENHEESTRKTLTEED